MSNSTQPTKQELIDHVESLVAKCAELTKERDAAITLVETIVHDVDVLSTRPAATIGLNDLVFRINEWGDAARKILKESSENA